MEEQYKPQEIEANTQQLWEEKNTFQLQLCASKMIKWGNSKTNNISDISPWKTKKNAE